MSGEPVEPVEPAGDAPDPPPQPERDWKEEYLREVARSRRYRQRAQRTEAEMEALRPRALTDDEVAEVARLREAAAAAEGKDERIAALEAMVRRVVGANELSKALAACGVGRGWPRGDRMLAQAASLLADRIDVDLSGDAPEARVIGDDGQPLAAGDGSESGAMTVSDFVARWLAEEGAHFLPPSGDTGSGAHQGVASEAEPSLERLDRDPGAKAEFIARHGPQAYVQLARRRA